MAGSTYHLMRNFIAVMRSLGYPRQMSVENFCRPNFPLMADILVYLLRRFDPKIELSSSNIETEDDRMKFIMNASHLMVNRANLDINVKKLYMADINSVQEMIKLAKLIQDAWIKLAQDHQQQKHKNNQNVINEENEYNDSDDADDQSKDKLNAVQDGVNFDRNKISNYNSFKTNQITSEIYDVATKLYDTIPEYDQKKDQLYETLNKQLVIDQIETQIRKNIKELQQNIVDMQQRKQNIDRDNEDLNVKIEKKRAELNRNKKRHQTLYAQRPAYQDELDKIEQEIIELYDHYVTNSRCLYFLEQKLEEFEKLERQKIEEHNNEIKEMLERIKIDDFLKTNDYNMRISTWNNQQNDITDDRNDELAAIVDIDDDAGHISGSDFSDKDINEMPKKTVRQKMRSTNKNDRSLMVNTVIKGQRSPINSINNNISVINQRSAKTAKLLTYGSLMENDDDDDDDDTDTEHSKTNAKMTDSEIDLDAIDDSEDDESMAIDYTGKSPSNIDANDEQQQQQQTKISTNSKIKLSVANLDRGDDDF